MTNGKSILQFKVFILFIMILAALSSCDIWHQSDFAIPKREIVFQSNNGKDYQIGFMDSDGSSVKLFSTGDVRVTQPVWSNNRDSIYFRNITMNPIGEEAQYYGTAMVMLNHRWPPKNVCNLSIPWSVFPLPEEGDFIYTDGLKIVEQNTNRCNDRQTLIDFSSESNPKTRITSIFPSKDKEFLLFTTDSVEGGNHEERINRYSFKSRETITITDGMNATLSPDKKAIAYVKSDGIFTADVDGKNEKLLIFYQGPNSPYDALPPVPYWSSDGKWLLYHKCRNTDRPCENASDFSIYKINVPTREEVKLYDGGLYPYW